MGCPGAPGGYGLGTVLPDGTGRNGTERDATVQ